MPRFQLSTGGPGVHAFVNTAQIGRPAPVEGSDAFFVVGTGIWGPVNQATSVTGQTDFANQFGGLSPNSRLADAVYAFFEQGGSRAHVVRVVGAAAAVATLTLNDRAGVPLATLRVDAKYPSSVVDVRVTVEAGTEPNSVRLRFRSVKLNRDETFDNVRLTFTQQELDVINAGKSPLTSIQFINNTSTLVKLTDLAS
ncbi:MAG TPA: hypothetical protein VGV38_00955, partial [Pyrinomonadaceae bacterium]|nr:hypothetical protein [Pyrinomonadaceae bacterium]